MDEPLRSVKYAHLIATPTRLPRYPVYFADLHAIARYFFTEPHSPDENRMFIDSGKGTHRIYLMSEEAEESVFEYPES
jgi:hypothetical protein